MVMVPGNEEIFGTPAFRDLADNQWRQCDTFYIQKIMGVLVYILFDAHEVLPVSSEE